MRKSDLIEIITEKIGHLPCKVVGEAVKMVFELMGETLSNGERIEIRGFGSFAPRYRPACVARNPKTGEQIMTEGGYTVRFRPGKELRERVNN